MAKGWSSASISSRGQRRAGHRSLARFQEHTPTHLKGKLSTDLGRGLSSPLLIVGKGIEQSSDGAGEGATEVGSEVGACRARSARKL